MQNGKGHRTLNLMTKSEMLHCYAKQNPLFPLQYLQSLANKSTMQNEIDFFYVKLLLVTVVTSKLNKQTLYRPRRLIVI